MKRTLVPVLLFFSLLFAVSYSSCFPESAVKQKKIDRERRKKEAEARKSYEIDLKKHHKNQSKETRAMMKESRRKSKKVTPLRK